MTRPCPGPAQDEPLSSGHAAPPVGLRTIPQSPLSPASSRLTSRPRLHFSEPLIQLLPELSPLAWSPGGADPPPPTHASQAPSSLGALGAARLGGFGRQRLPASGLHPGLHLAGPREPARPSSRESQAPSSSSVPPALCVPVPTLWPTKTSVPGQETANKQPKRVTWFGPTSSSLPLFVLNCGCVLSGHGRTGLVFTARRPPGMRRRPSRPRRPSGLSRASESPEQLLCWR